MITLFKKALEIQDFFVHNKWKFCFIGGIAIQRWGEPRLTINIDITLITGFGSEESFIDNILERYKGRISNVKKFALKNRVLLLSSSNNIDIDIALGGLQFEKEMINRASLYKFLPDVSLLTCSAEDLIILKAFADRPKDWIDIESIIIRQIKNLNKKYIISRLAPLCELKESPHIINQLEKIIFKYTKK